MDFKGKTSSSVSDPASSVPPSGQPDVWPSERLNGWALEPAITTRAVNGPAGMVALTADILDVQ
jgi:hypothetical protein